MAQVRPASAVRKRVQLRRPGQLPRAVMRRSLGRPGMGVTRPQKEGVVLEPVARVVAMVVQVAPWSVLLRRPRPESEA